MEWIRISEHKLKIMLSAQDARRYALDFDGDDLTPPTSKESFRGVLSDLFAQTGFDASEDKIYIQFYPSKDGGCELFITKVGLSPDSPHGETLEKERRSPPEKRRGIAFSSGDLNAICALCRRLAFRRFAGESELWRDEGGDWWLLISERGNPRTLSEDYRFAREYAVPRTVERAALLLPEHAKKICAKKAVEIFSKL